MGLDMYLKAQRYLSPFNEEEKRISQAVSAVIGVIREGEDLDAFGRVSNVEFGVGYWRKANAIHKWFVDTCQKGDDDCRDAYVSREHLAKLREACCKALRSESEAAEVLPTQEGFFFGSTEYDEYYKSDLKDTITIIDKALALSEDWEFRYHSSW